MPVLGISGKSEDDDRCEVYRRILFPNDEKMNECLFFMQEAKKLVECDNLADFLQEPLLGMLRVEHVKLIVMSLMYCPSVDEMNRIIKSCLEYSLISAIFLVNFYKLYNQGERVSLKIVTYATENILRKTGLKIGDISKTRKTYGDSAHLAAAFLLASGDKADLAHVLAGAEVLREFGEGFHLENRDIPLLNPATTWKVPSEYKLPGVEIRKGTDDVSLSALAQEYIKNAIWAKRSR